MVENDLLGEGVTLGHLIVPDHSSWVGWHNNLDVELLGETMTDVAHYSTPFMRPGTTLESLERHLDAGAVLGIGPDTIPHDFIGDMRFAAILARSADHDGNTAKIGDVFNAGTVGGAKTLMRNDIGRLAVGARADIVVIDCNYPMMLPSRDPLMCLIHSAAGRAVKDVYIDGIQTVCDHEFMILDWQVATEKIVDGQARMETAVEDTDFLGRTSQEIAPLSLPVTEPG